MTRKTFCNKIQVNNSIGSKVMARNVDQNIFQANSKNLDNSESSRSMDTAPGTSPGAHLRPEKPTLVEIQYLV